MSRLRPDRGSEYQPGYCNIGRDERTRRYRLAGVTILAAVGYLAVVLLSGLDDVLLVGLFVPLTLGFEWLVQAHLGFCVSLALSSEYDLRGSGGDRGTVEASQHRRTDRLHAARITAVAVGAALVVTAAVCLPVLTT